MFLAAITADDYEKAFERIQKIIEDNKGPQVWTASSEYLP